MIGKPTKKTPRIIRSLGLLNEQRGRDSTGFALFTDAFTDIHKNTLKASDFFQTKRVNRLLTLYRKQPFVVIIGHTRAATVGDINQANAHPFERGQFVFTHNGHIANHTSLSMKLKTDYQVDSELLGELLVQGESYQEAFKDVAGYFTMPFINRNEIDNLRVAIHDNVFSFAKRNNQLYYSSDMEHLREALKNETGFTFCQGGKDVLYSFYPQVTDKSITISQSPLTMESKNTYPFSCPPSKCDSDEDRYGEMYEDYVGKYEKPNTIIDMRSPLQQIEEMEDVLLDIRDEIRELKSLATYVEKRVKELKRPPKKEIIDIKTLLNKKYYNNRREKRLKLAKAL